MKELKALNSYEFFELELVHDNKILVVTLNRPPVNAFVKESYIELSSIVSYVNYEIDISVMVLRSEGKMFSAGADVKRLAADDPKESAIRRSAMRKAGSDLYNCSVPVVCGINGAAVGAGAIFASCADIIVASESAFFAIPEIDIGLVGGAKALWRVIPPQKLRMMALTGMRCSAQEAYRFGGVEAVVPGNELNDKVMEYARVLASKEPMALRKWKEALLLTETVSPQEGLLIEHCLGQESGWFNPNPTIKKGSN